MLDKSFLEYAFEMGGEEAGEKMKKNPGIHHEIKCRLKKKGPFKKAAIYPKLKSDERM